MLISEIFYSVQGEGILTGVPSVFIRTSGCNLRCRWCDTPYASWKPEGVEMTEDAILEKAHSWPAARHVVLTGGEPMIAKGVRSLLRRLRAEGFHITIETAGTVALNDSPCDLASLSPKLAHSTPLPGEIDTAWITRHENTRLQPDVINDWLRNASGWQLKFVVAGEDHLAEIRELLAKLDAEVPPDRVLLMPEGRSMEELRERAAWLVEACKDTGFRFCHRLHIELFGNKRGT